MNVYERLNELARLYRQSDKYVPELHVDIFLIPRVTSDDVEVTGETFKEVHHVITKEIVRYTNMTYEEARVFHANNDIETWFGDDEIFDTDVYAPFYVRYDIPKNLLRKFDTEYKQGPSATFEVTI